MKTTPNLLRRLLLAAGLAALAPWAAAQDYPTKPVRIIVPFAAGGPADVYARFLATKLQESMGQPFVVDNRPGAGSIIGTDAVAKSPGDGYTLLLMSNTHTVNESLIPTKPFQLLRDFAPIAPINASDLVLVTRATLPASNLGELIRLAKAKPGSLSYASSGPGTPYHMAGELFKAMAGLAIVHIPYRGSSGARTDVLGGQVDMMFDAVTTMTEHVKAGKVKAMGTTGAARSSVMPDVPTLAEAGVPKYEATIWLGLMAPKATPPAIVERLNAEVSRIVGAPETAKAWTAQGAQPMVMSVAEFTRYVASGHREVGEHRQDLRGQARAMSGAGDTGRAPVLHLLCAGAVKGLVEALRERFRAESGATIDARFGAVGAMREALLGGAPCDVLVVTEAMLAELREHNRIAAAPLMPIGEVRTGVAARGGDALPRIDSAAALKAALLGTPALYVPDTVRSTAGRHVVSVLERLGLAAELAPRLSEHANGATAMRALSESGVAGALGCTQVTEILYTPGLAFAGALPEPFGLATVYAAGVGRDSAEPALAADFIALLAGDDAAAIRRAGGFEPAAA